MQLFDSYIVDASWERIYFRAVIELQKDVNDEIHFYLLNNAFRVEAEFDIEKSEGRRYELCLNITNNGTNRCVDNGTYTIGVTVGDEYLSEVGFCGTEHQLASWGRAFLYNGTSGVFSVNCSLDEYSESSRFLMIFHNGYKRKLGNRIGFANTVLTESRWEIAKKKYMNKLLNLRKKYFRKIQKYLYHITCYLAGPKRDKTVLFLSEQDRRIPLNMKAVYDRMVERGLDKEYRILFSLRDAAVHKNSTFSAVKMTVYLGMAGTVIVDDHVPLFDYMVIREDTNLIQIWHAGAGFKGIGYSRWGHFGCPGPFSAHRQYTYCISGSTPINHFFSEQFGILYEQIIPTGMPRMDAFIRPENRVVVTENIYRTYPALKDKKIILFAPTYRGRNKMMAYYPYDKIDFEGLYDLAKKKDACVLFKMHPFVTEAVPIRKEHADRFIDMNTYPNINELFYITDLLITDYSSSMYEFLLMDKPMLMYVFDKVQYSTSRGFHRDYDSNVPGRICETFEDLLEAMEKEDYEFEKVSRFKEQYFDFVDDHNCDRVIDWLILGKLPEEFSEALKKKREYIEKTRGTDFSEYLMKDEADGKAGKGQS